MIHLKKKHFAAFFPSFVFFIMGLLGTVFAYFTVSALSSQNTFSTGAMQLSLSDVDEIQSATLTNTWEATDLRPGSILPERKIEVYNTGDIDADHVDIQFSYTGDEDLAKNFLFSNTNTGFRYGGSSDGSSVNLTTALRGTTDTDYIVTQGANGQPFATGTVDGIDGSVKDGKISLHELSQFGKIRIQRGEQFGGMVAGTATDLWLNATIADTLTSQNGSLDMKITVSLDQHASQF